MLNSLRYYVNTTQSPPQVSYTRPTGPPPPMQWVASGDPWGSPGAQPYPAGLPATNPVQPRLTAAQRLYASSASKVVSNPTSSNQPLNSNMPPVAAAPPFPSLPTPPPSNSPPPSIIHAPTIPPPLPYDPYPSPSSPDTMSTTSGFYHTSIASRQPQAHPRGARGPSTSTRPSTASGPAHTPSYGNHSSYQAPPPSQKNRRSLTFSAGMPSNKSTVIQEPTGPKVTPTFSLMARPPPNHANTMSAISTQTAVVSPTPGVYPTPPQSFLIPNQVASPPAASPTTLPVQQVYLPITPQQTYVPVQAVAPAPPPKSNNNNNNKKLKELGLAAGKTIFKVAGNVAAASMGLPPNVGGSIAGSLVDSNVVGALVNCFSSNDSQNAGSADVSQLQAVLQGQPGADYQSVINTLLQQQQRQQKAAQPPAVDYQAVIQQLQSIQQLAAAQQQASAQQQQQVAAQQSQILMSAAAAAQNQQALQLATANPQAAQAYQQQLQLQQQQLQAQQQEQQKIAMATYQQQLQQQQQQQANINAFNAAQAQQVQQLQLQLAQQQQQQTLMTLQQPAQAPANPTNHWMQGLAEAISGPPAGQEPSPLGGLLSSVGQALAGMGNNDSSSGDNSGTGDTFLSFNAESLYSPSGDDTSW
ncbi:hypothetical protein BD779DRAFT_869539 [Infundibulicybe gibba]|nr:hypothetical protein BD779DRAFT_869539 [Infundibulicybe gibba]